MNAEPHEAAFSKAFQAADPAAALLRLATDLRDQETAQQSLYELFERQRARYEDMAAEAIYDAILDTMDHIVGWSHRPLYAR